MIRRPDVTNLDTEDENRLKNSRKKGTDRGYCFDIKMYLC